ncbi:MAG: peptidylprolyl isomerase [Pseudomonadota bacterium]
MSAATRQVLNQPLLHFLVLGALLFAADFFLSSNADDPRSIVIDDAKYAEIAGIFSDNQGRAPTEEEMADLTIKWAQNEVLYREAQLMELDKGDEMIRQRLILKLRNVLFNKVVMDTPTEEKLVEWFEANRVRYDKPAKYDFEQFKVADADGEAIAVDLAAELGEAPPTGEWENRLRRYAGRPAMNLQGAFGEDDAAALIGREDNAWQPVTSPAGWHLARVTARYPGVPADMATVRTRVVEDYKAAATQQELAQSLGAIAQRYDIRLELTAPPEEWDEERLEQLRVAMETDR